MLRFLLAALLALAPAAAFAQTREAAPGLWSNRDGRATLVAARISFPDRAGEIARQGNLEFSRPGEGLDNILQYRSRDGRVIGTVYIYYPGLAHAGLSAYATDQAIHIAAPDVRALGARVVTAGGMDGAGIRLDYAGYRGMASSAAFIKAGRWIVKIRVSGPEDRRREVEEAMAALLDGVRFEGEARPRPAALLEPADCRTRPSQAGRLLPSRQEDLAGQSLIAIFDATGVESTSSGRPILPRFGARWCLSTRARVGDGLFHILRAEGDDGDGIARSVMVVTLNDAGTALELLEMRPDGRFVLLHHQIGRTAILGTYDRNLTDAQIAAILGGTDREGGQIRATINLRANGNTETILPTDEGAPAGPST